MQHHKEVICFIVLLAHNAPSLVRSPHAALGDPFNLYVVERGDECYEWVRVSIRNEREDEHECTVKLTASSEEESRSEQGGAGAR